MLITILFAVSTIFAAESKTLSTYEYFGTCPDCFTDISLAKYTIVELELKEKKLKIVANPISSECFLPQFCKMKGSKVVLEVEAGKVDENNLKAKGSIQAGDYKDKVICSFIPTSTDRVFNLSCSKYVEQYVLEIYTEAVQL